MSIYIFFPSFFFRIVTPLLFFFFFFFNDTATTEIYTLSLHDALPISQARELVLRQGSGRPCLDGAPSLAASAHSPGERSEEHTSELQSRLHLVCRLLLEKKKKHTLARMSLAQTSQTVSLYNNKMSDTT